jgi:urocanate hydratase
MGGDARRKWARNENAITTSIEYNKNYGHEDNAIGKGFGHITIPYIPSEELIEKTVDKFLK